MSKKRPTESSWDSDEELLSDTAGISAFPKSSELDLLTEDGELDEEALLGLDESGAAFNNDPRQPGLNRQRSKTAGSSHQEGGALANQAFVFEVADSGDLEEELTGNELGNQGLATYSHEGEDSYSHEVYEEDPILSSSHQMATETDQLIYSSAIAEDGNTDPQNEQDNYTGHDTEAETYLSEQSEFYAVTDTNVLTEDTTNNQLEYDNSAQDSNEVHLEYEDEQPLVPLKHVETEQEEDPQEQTYESDSDSDDDSRHSRGKFKSERTGVISLAATTERESIPDTLEINDNQAAQIKEFMSGKPTRDSRGRGGRNRGRLSVHNRLGIRPGLGPQPGMMFGGERMRMMNPRFQSPLGPRGLGIPRRFLGPRPMLGGMRPQMPPRGPAMGGPFNPMLARGPPRGDRFPLGPMRPQGNIPMIGPGALLEPMKQLLQRMRGPHPGSPRIGPGIFQRLEGVMGMPLAGPGNMRGGHEPRIFLGSPQNRMLRPPQQLLSPERVGPMLIGPGGIQTSPNLQNQLNQPIRGRLPLHQRLGPAGHLPINNKIFVNPLFQGQQGGPLGLKRTVKMGLPMHQRKARALLEKAKQTQMKQTSAPAVAMKRKSTGGDDVASKIVKKEEDEEKSVRVVEKKVPTGGDSKEISTMLEEQKRKRELIQKRKELARQRLAEEKRKELEKKTSEGNKIESIIGRSGNSDERKVEKSNNTTSIKVVSRSISSRLGPPPSQAHKVQFQNRGPSSQPIRGPHAPNLFRGPQPQSIRGSHIRSQLQHARAVQPQGIRGSLSQQIRGPHPQQMRGLQPQQIRGQQSQQIRGPPPQQIRNPQVQLRGNPPRFNTVSQYQSAREPLQQNLSKPPPQVVTRAEPGVRPQQPNRMAVPLLPQHILSQPPPPIGASHLQQQTRGPPPQQTRGIQQSYQVPGPQQLRGPPPQQPSLHVRPPVTPQINPAQLRGPPPVTPQSQAQLVPSNFGYQANPTASSRFISPPSYPHQQQSQSQYDAGFMPQTVNAAQPSLVQQHQFSAPPPQSSSQYFHGGSSVSIEPVQNVNYSQSVYQQSFPSQPEYQQPAAPLYTGAVSIASSTLTPQSVAPTYQYSESQAYAGASYENQQPASMYQTHSQQQYTPQQGQTRFPLAQDASYSSSSDYYASSRPIQTIQTVSNQSYHEHSQEGQKIQTIGQHIQPVTGTQMRSIIHNVATSPKTSSSSDRSVQQKTPTLHISRAVMEGNVPVLPGSQKVIILNVPQMATRETLIRLCRHFGHVEGVNLMRDQNKAVVQFQKGEQAAKCVSKCDQKCLHKTRLTVKLLPS